MGRSKKKSDEHLDAKERARREKQRQARELALKLQKEGKSKKEIKSKILKEIKCKPKPKVPGGYRANTSSYDQGGRYDGGYSGSYGKNWNEGNNNYNSAQRGYMDRHSGKRQRDEPKVWQRDEIDYSKYDTREEADQARKRDMLAKRHDLVIIPIYWRFSEEAELVQEAAQDVKNKLMKHNRLNVWIDSRTSLTPVQKYKYYESLGVNFRVEIGPEEAKSSTLTISKANPSGVAERWKGLTTDVENFHDVLTVLKDQGLPKLRDFDPQEEHCSACDLIREEEKDKPAKPVKLPRSATAAAETAAASRKHVEFNDDDDDDDDEKDKSSEVKSNPIDASGDGLEANYVL